MQVLMEADMKITTVALLTAVALPATTFAASPDPEGASGSTAGVYGGESSSTTSQESGRGTASSMDATHSTIPAQPQSNGSSTTGAGSDPASGMSGSGAANTGQKTTTAPSYIGPREPGDMTGGSPAR
jgi:hypothetical protein